MGKFYKFVNEETVNKLYEELGPKRIISIGIRRRVKNGLFHRIQVSFRLSSYTTLHEIWQIRSIVKENYFIRSFGINLHSFELNLVIEKKMFKKRRKNVGRKTQENL